MEATLILTAAFFVAASLYAMTGHGCVVTLRDKLVWFHPEKIDAQEKRHAI